MNYEEMTIEQLEQELAEKATRKEGIETRLKEPTISDSTVRELLKTKNELVADIQAIEIALDNIRKQLL